jgi:peptidoglycan/LPS O-acetylase OafA/YrhL
MDQTGSRRIDDIEVLRALAVGLVLVEHAAGNLLPSVSVQAGFYHTFRGWSGVDLFFAISGFVIARSLLPMLAETRGARAYFQAALSFWVRRAWRLLPSAWLWLGVMLLLAATFNTTQVFGPLGVNLKAAFAAFLNVENFLLWKALGRGELSTPNIHWTLSLEEQFYLVLPLLVFAARKRLPLVLAAIVLAQIFTDRTGIGHLLLNLTRSDALALGVLLAIWSDSAGYRKVEPKWLAASPLRFLVAPVFVVVFAAATGPVFVPGRFTLGALALLAAGVVWLASYDAGIIAPPGRLKRVLCWMGTRSYALYLCHLPVFHATVELWSRLDPEVLKAGHGHLRVLLLTGLPLTFALAELNYRFVETPFRRQGARIAERIRLGRAGAVPAAAHEAA